MAQADLVLEFDMKYESSKNHQRNNPRVSKIYFYLSFSFSLYINFNNIFDTFSHSSAVESSKNLGL